MGDDEVPRGFRFFPTEEELVSFYLHNKLNRRKPEIDRVIPLLDVYDYNPSDLPRLGGEYCPAGGEQWFFFTPRHEREARGGRPNRLTKWGYWKATGSPGDVYSSQNRVIGRKRTMVFYVGRAPNGTKTLWKMVEYKARDELPSPATQLREELCLCRIYKKSKSLRAFDRRPPSVAVLHRHRNEATALNNTSAPEITDYSLSSSSSGDNAADVSQFAESGDNRRPEKPSDGEIFWDFERLNWVDLLRND